MPLRDMKCNTYSSCQCRSLTDCTDTNQRRCHISSCGARAVEKLRQYCTKTGPFQIRVLKLLIDNQLERYHISYNMYFPMTVHPSTRCLRYERLIPCAIWQWCVSLKITILQHFTLLFQQGITLWRACTKILFHHAHMHIHRNMIHTGNSILYKKLLVKKKNNIKAPMLLKHNIINHPIHQHVMRFSFTIVSINKSTNHTKIM